MLLGFFLVHTIKTEKAEFCYKIHKCTSCRVSKQCLGEGGCLLSTVLSLCIVQKILDLSRLKLQAVIQTRSCQPSQGELTDCEAITNTKVGQVKI